MRDSIIEYDNVEIYKCYDLHDIIKFMKLCSFV